ncbi:MAG: hypothetical protein M1834_008080 [Cirrosporium novae-zelandiae]|nr:MAG: hypothetical protein M1834_008080 [Cirrosporium novae-zelandiae]
MADLVEHNPNILIAESEQSSSERDTESATGDDARSLTGSLSEAASYRYENGRRYLDTKDSGYVIPSDNIESERLDLEHTLWYLTLIDRQWLAPIPDDVKEVLDVGCGTGTWAMDFAREHPQANVLGIDLCPTEPPSVPPNCTFKVTDGEADWEYDHQFDFIHSRILTIGFKDWPRYFRQAYANLKPGGWFEVQEPILPFRCNDDSATSANSALIQWSEYLLEGAAYNGLFMGVARRFFPMLTSAGFENIHVQQFQWPSNSWGKGDRAKKMGVIMREDFQELLAGASLAVFTRYLGWTKEQLDEFIVDYTNGMPGIRIVYWAQKPEEEKKNDV